MLDTRLIGKVKRHVHISDCVVSNNPNEVLVTHGLGSCIGLAIWDKKLKLGGMLHFQLPTAGDKKNQSQFNMNMYGDTGIHNLLTLLGEYGAQWNQLRVVVVGGATINQSADVDYFAVGKRNIIAVKKMLWNNKLMIDAEHVGDSISRTFYLDVESGQTWFTTGGHHGLVIEL